MTTKENETAADVLDAFFGDGTAERFGVERVPYESGVGPSEILVPAPSEAALRGMDAALSKMTEMLESAEGADFTAPSLAELIHDLTAARGWLMRVNSLQWRDQCAKEDR